MHRVPHTFALHTPWRGEYEVIYKIYFRETETTYKRIQPIWGKNTNEKWMAHLGEEFVSGLFESPVPEACPWNAWHFTWLSCGSGIGLCTASEHQGEEGVEDWKMVKQHTHSDAKWRPGGGFWDRILVECIAASTHMKAVLSFPQT